MHQVYQRANEERDIHVDAPVQHHEISYLPLIAVLTGYAHPPGHPQPPSLASL
jgi:hypothetical protein